MDSKDVKVTRLSPIVETVWGIVLVGVSCMLVFVGC